MSVGLTIWQSYNFHLRLWTGTDWVSGSNTSSSLLSPAHPWHHCLKYTLMITMHNIHHTAVSNEDYFKQAKLNSFCFWIWSDKRYSNLGQLILTFCSNTPALDWTYLVLSWLRMTMIWWHVRVHLCFLSIVSWVWPQIISLGSLGTQEHSLKITSLSFLIPQQQHHSNVVVAVPYYCL